MFKTINMGNSIIEVVIDSVHSAIAAADGGASRVELCDNLFEGGTTPSTGTIHVVRKSIEIDLNVMIRPRGGDFFYSKLEFEIMKKDIEMAKSFGVDGVVFGILNEDGTIDKKRCLELIYLARPLSVTFHRAFDMTRDPFKALEDLKSLKVDRVLTSGQENSAFEGADLLRELVEKAGDHIIVMPGGGITEKNIARIKAITKAKEYHISGRSKIESKMAFRNHNIFMGGALRMEEFAISVADSQKIKNFKRQLEN